MESFVSGEVTVLGESFGGFGRFLWEQAIERTAHNVNNSKHRAWSDGILFTLPDSSLIDMIHNSKEVYSRDI